MAYFVGYIDHLDNYADKESMKYAYEMGNAHGGQWIAIQDHAHKNVCKWKYVTAKGLCNGVEAFLKQYKATTVDKQVLADAIEKGLPGFRVVHDATGIDAPIMLYNEDIIVGADTEKLTFDEKWKRIEKMGEYLESKIKI